MEQNSTASVIILFTDAEKLQEAKVWIEKQSMFCNLELIALDNREGQFKSAAQGLNYGAAKSCGEYLFFMHQDVYLWDLLSIEKYCKYLQENPQTIIGVAGVPANMGTVTDIFETKEKIERGNRANGKEYLVDALDECLLAMKKERWQQLHFDEVCCDNWHGYGMDICYSNTLKGGKNVMLPLRICHDSLGTPHSASYRATMKNLVRKYRGTAIRQLHGTCIQISCNWRSFYWYAAKEWIKELIHYK